MMIITRVIAGAVAVVASVGVLTGCGTDASSQDEAGTPAPAATQTSAETAESIETPAPSESETAAAPVSDIESAVQTVVGALDELGIEHSEPVRTEVGASGAKAVFDITINGHDAGINVFPDPEALAAWQELSDAFGGIHVAFDNSALSLNSGEGIANSAEIAPQIAAQIGGEARGV